MRRVAVGVAGVAVLGLVAGGVWATGSNDRGAGEEPPVTLGRTQAVAALTSVNDCDALLKHLKKQGRAVVGPFGLDGTPIYTFRSSGGAVAEDSSASAAGASELGAAATPKAAKAPDSTTNVQVAGVDESDVVKTTGDLMLAVVNGQLKITRMDGGNTRTLATWADPTVMATSVLVEGTRAVVIGSAQGGGSMQAGGSGQGGGPASGVASDDLMPVPSAEAVKVTVLDLADPENPRVVQALSVDGSMTGSARLVEGRLRFALTSSPNRITWKQPDFTKSDDPDDQRKAMDRATDANRKVLDRTTIDDWLPRATVTTDGQRATRDLVDCRNVSIPKTFSGLQTLTMVQLGLDGVNPLGSWGSAAVLASGSTLYATADHAWLSTQPWGTAATSAGPLEDRFAPVTSSTQIHLFDTPLTGAPKYRASGSVKGSLVNQFAMDERNGVLRVATTVDGAATAVKDSATSSATGVTENQITTLEPDGEKLTQLGRLTGLGAGERIYGVRFAGDLGYVVTFRQTDPLFTVDLADPAKPVLRGELKIPGYSAYLHPVSDERLLGLGQDGTQGGQLTGLQLSLFDVSKADATRLDRVRLPGAWSDAESDHHAFTMTGNLVLVPFSAPDPMLDPAAEPVEPVAPDDTVSGKMARVDSGVLAVRIYGSSIGEPQKLSTPANPMRALVHDGDVYTLTEQGVAVHAPTDTGFQSVTVARF